MSEVSSVEKSSAPPEVEISMKKVAVASVIGTTVEWYDLFVFATACVSRCGACHWKSTAWPN